MNRINQKYNNKIMVTNRINQLRFKLIKTMIKPKHQTMTTKQHRKMLKFKVIQKVSQIHIIIIKIIYIKIHTMLNILYIIILMINLAFKKIKKNLKKR